MLPGSFWTDGSPTGPLTHPRPGCTHPPGPVRGFLLLPPRSDLGNDVFPLRKGNFLEGLPPCPCLPRRRGLHFIPLSKPPPPKSQPQGGTDPGCPFARGKRGEGLPSAPPLCRARLGTPVVPEDSCQEEPAPFSFPCLLPRPSPFPQPRQLPL